MGSRQRFGEIRMASGLMSIRPTPMGAGERAAITGEGS